MILKHSVGIFKGLHQYEQFFVLPIFAIGLLTLLPHTTSLQNMKCQDIISFKLDGFECTQK